MAPEEIESLFRRSDGTYLFARWTRPIVPVVFGVDDATLGVIKGALQAVTLLAGHAISDADVELGANLMFFAVRDWDELRAVPNLDRLIPGLHQLCDRLQEASANQYRLFRFEADGAIRAAFVFLRVDAHLAAMPVDALALSQVVQVILLWSDSAFSTSSPLAQVEHHVILRPEIAAVIRAGYDPVLPSSTSDPSHALRLMARVQQRHLPAAAPPE